MKTLILVIQACLIFNNSFSQNQTETNDRFAVVKGDFTTTVTSESLTISAQLVKPTTLPACSDPESWNIIQKSSFFKKLGDINGQVQKVVYKTNNGQLENEIWTSDANDLVAFRQTFTNKLNKPVRLSKIFPLYIEGKDALSFGNTVNWRILEQFRHKNDFPKAEKPAASQSVVCDPFFVINNNEGNGKNLFIGYQTFYLHLADIGISFDKDLNLNNILASCDFEGVEVPTDGSRTSQWIIISHGDDVNQLIDDYTERFRAYYDSGQTLKNAPSVYCTWYYYADNYNEEIFKQDIDQFRKEHLPFEVFLIDECWDVNDWGDFEANNRFPHGMKWVAGEINSLGYTAGIWTAPFLVDGESELADQHPAWLLKNSKGNRCTFKMNNRDHFILDLTYPGVCEYLEEQFRKISREWGYKYYKFDFMRSVFLDTDQQFYDRSATSLEAYRRGLEAIRRGTGSDAYISVCGGHYGASYGIANSQRSGSDVKSQWNENELPKYRQNILRTWMSGLWHVDPDAMMVRRKDKPEWNDKRELTTGFFTDGEAFTNAINQFIGGNLITFTENFASLDYDRKMLYKYVIPSVNSASRPLDPFNLDCPEIMITRVVPRCIKLGNWNMLSIINWSNESKTYDIILDDRITGNLEGSEFLVFDFQSQEIAGWKLKDSVMTVRDIPAHQSSVLKIVPWNGKSPMFLGTDLNLSCGGVEIAEIDYSSDYISGLIETGWDVPVKLSFIVPGRNGFILKQTTVTSSQKKFYIGL